MYHCKGLYNCEYITLSLVFLSLLENIPFSTWTVKFQVAGERGTRTLPIDAHLVCKERYILILLLVEIVNSVIP